jgi:hypothetical protein
MQRMRHGQGAATFDSALSGRASAVAIFSIAGSCFSAWGNAAAICFPRAGAWREGVHAIGSTGGADKQWCEEHGAVYLAGSGTRAYGETEDHGVRTARRPRLREGRRPRTSEEIDDFGW